MRYDDNHKQETRRRIVSVASAALRSQGSSVGVADIMGRAGLTHGGFYAHFPSKEALLDEALDEGFDQGIASLERVVAAAAPQDRLAAVVDLYLSETHRDLPQHGCPVAALVSEAPHMGAECRSTFTAGIRRVLRLISGLLAERGCEDCEGLAMSIFSEMVGAVALSRAMSAPELSARVLADARVQILRRAVPGQSRPTLQG